MLGAQAQLVKLLDEHPLTTEMFVRVHGDNLIAGRREPIGPNGQLEDDDRIRFTRLTASSYGLSVKRHTGRWERTPFSGPMENMVQAVLACMQHLIAPSFGCTETFRARH